MGIHADLLELRRGSFDLLPRHALPEQSRTFGVSLEPSRAGSILRRLSIRLLDLGYVQQPEEPVQAGGAWDTDGTNGSPATTVADGQESPCYHDPSGRIDSC